MTDQLTEIAQTVRRASHRLKNSGDLQLAEMGLQTSKKIKRQKSLTGARRMEEEYSWILKTKYFPSSTAGIPSK